MNKRSMHMEYKRVMTLPRVILGGFIIFFLTVFLAGHVSLVKTEKLAENAMDTLKNQCSGYERLMAAERTKSLFRLADIMQSLSRQLSEEKKIVTDAWLERYVRGMRISGIAVLDENLTLKASGYTKQYRNSEWMETQDGSRFSDIIDHPAKVFAERITVDGDYYDICAVARRDERGILIGFYKQPTGLIADTEDDLESLLTGLKLECQGNYIILENDIVRASSDSAVKNLVMEDSEVLKPLVQLKKNGHLRLFYSGRRYYWGYRDGYENYGLYLFYPLLAPVSSAFMVGVVAVSVYTVLFLLLFDVRNRTLVENQESLRKSNDKLTETVKMLKSLETIYFSLFMVDLENDTYHTISISRYLKDKISPKGVYTELKKFFLDKMIVPAYHDEIDAKMSREYIQNSVSRENMTEVRRSFYADFQVFRERKIKWCRVSVTVVNFDENGKPVQVLVLLQDVDKEKTKEAEYQARILDESQKAKLANIAKTDFLRRISHDVKTPLNGIRGYIEMGSHEPDNETLQKYCREKAMIAVDTLFELVNSVLEMSDLEGQEVQLEEIPFDLEVLLNEVNTVVKPQAIARNINCEILQDKVPEVTHLIGSPRHVSQVLMNLASNGVRFGTQDGWLRLGVKLISRTEQHVTYEFCFADNGIGMSEEFQKHMYEPFTQEAGGARTTYGGTGLGLAIVKKLVDALGGSITFHSEKNVGTTFTVQLTFRIDREYYNRNRQAEEEKSASYENTHILLVEDNELNMEIADFVLEEQGIKITKAWNGKEAVDTFNAAEIGEFDAILMDIMMPEMDGLEAARTIRASGRPDAETIPIIAMSANAFQEDVQKSLAAGMNDHIAKPIDISRLWATLKKYIG